MFHSDRLFDPLPAVLKIAQDIYKEIKDLPILNPYSHVKAKWFSQNKPFSDPTELIILSDHNILRLLYSQGIALERLGIKTLDNTPYEKDTKKIWRIFGEHYYLFAGTPTGMCIDFQLQQVFGITKKLNAATCMDIYYAINEKLKKSKFLPQNLFEHFKIEVLATTNSAYDTLEEHQKIKSCGWKGKVIPCFCADDVVDLKQPNWRKNIQRLSKVCGFEISSFKKFIQALQQRREFFKSLGAITSDHGIESPYAHEISPKEADEIFCRALKGKITKKENRQFIAHMLIEMAQMSLEDGLLMQLHPGSFRNHNKVIYQKFGADKGADIPMSIEFTRNLHELLNKYGNHPAFTLIVFTSDESTYSRDLAFLAGHYPAMKLGSSWRFHNGFHGIKRFREHIWETTSIYNTTSFIGDAKAFASIPAKYDIARRIDCNFLAHMVARHIVDLKSAIHMAKMSAYELSKKIYKL